MKIKKLIELKPVDGRRSFYGKATAARVGGVWVCYSYNTPVASVDDAGNVRRLWNGCSVTTSRHLRAFFATFGGALEEWKKQ
ncbi:MAG: hypothetical protein IKU25_05185 [Clostridia bacterium]|nr:hypothetical protein [Clostridia bacterium]